MKRKNGMVSIRLIFLVLSLFCSTVWAGLDDGLVAHWKLDKGSGNIAYDSVGDNDGIIYGDTAWVTGQIGGALDFDGDQDYIEVPDDDSLTPSDEFTIAFWLNNRGGQAAGLHKYASCPPGGRSFGFTVHEDVIGLRIYSSVNNYDVIIVDEQVPLEEWHHIAGTFNNGLSAIYVDGQLIGSQILSVNSMMNDDEPLVIGGHWGYCGPKQMYNRLNGKIDDIRIYNRSLSAEDIEELYTGEVNPVDKAIDQIQQAIDEKLVALEIIESALAKELAAYDALEDVLESGEYGDLKKADIIKAMQKTHSATQHQDQAIHQLDKSIEKLEDALDSLGCQDTE